MITVRFSTGFSVQYNEAHYTERGPNDTTIWADSTKRHIIAIAPKDAIVEHEAPCRTYNPIAIDSDEVRKELARLRRKMAPHA